MANTDPKSAEAESQHHTFVTNRIPWYVHVMWILFWILAIAYVLIYLFPALQEEILTPP